MKLVKIVKGDTDKFIFELDGSLVESVLIKHKDKITFCISCQIGCPIGCVFCATGKLFIRNLSANEIVNQVLFMVDEIGIRPDSIVYMGMGEPMLNLDNVIESVIILNDTSGFNFSQKKITISTCGIIDGFERLRLKTKCKLAVSLHATTDRVRNDLIPIDVYYADIVTAVHSFSRNTKDKVMIEYMLIAGINDTDSDLNRLKKFDNSKIIFNLSDYNFVSCCDFKKSDRIDYFKNELIKAGFKTLIRYSRGSTEGAACGQLAGKFSKF